MQTSLSKYRTDITDSVLDFVVDQWRCLGGGTQPTKGSPIVVDPEVLIALTTSVGRHDSRVFDGMIDWLAHNDQWINVQRLARIAADDGLADRPALGAVAAWLAAHYRSLKWRRLATTLRPEGDIKPSPLFVRGTGSATADRQRDGVFSTYGLARAPFALRGQAQPVRLRTPGALLCTSRAVFGVAIRADVMAFLVANDKVHARGFASTLGYNHMQVRAVLLALEQAGIATAHTNGRTRQYSIDRETWRPVLLEMGPAPEWVDWRRLARGLNTIVSGLWAIDAGRADVTVAESLVYDVMRAARDDILAAHSSLSHARGLSKILGVPLANRISAIHARPHY